MPSRSLCFFLGMLIGCVVIGAVFLTQPISPTPLQELPIGEREAPAIPQAVADGTNPVVGPAKVKLAVLVVFDQMRGDYIQRWSEYLGPNGFRRMQAEGTHFTNCYYPYGITSTGPGHASMLSGCSPDRHGITNNEWYDRVSGQMAYCAGTERYDIVPVPAPPTTPSTKSSTTVKKVGCPDRFLSPTVADVLKLATNGKSKVFGLSLKDRSAILPVGHKPDGAYWFNGQFVTSTYYRDSVHPWVSEFNRSKTRDLWYDKPWTRFRPDLDYVKLSGPDQGVGEAKSNGRGITFPHIMTGGKKELGKEYYESLANSPYGNDLLLAFAKACIVAEGLGTRDVPDLLTVSFSSNDLIGHTYGPDSQEVLDVTLRSDALMADFMTFLDDRVGKGQYAIVLTSDHGICPLPEYSAAHGREARRVPAVSLLLNAERHLQSKFGKLDGGFEDGGKPKRTTWIESISAPWLYVNERLCAAKGVKKEVVAAEYVTWLRQNPDVFNAYTAEELQKPESLDVAGKMMAKSYYAGRSGDLCVVLKSYFLIDKITSNGTSHGTPHDYDRHVPLAVFGPGAKHGLVNEAITPQHAATVLSHFLGIAMPKDCEYSLPETLSK